MRHRRQAFTLVEMMVSMVLVLFVMVMLTQAFTAGLEAFSYLKGIGDMEDRLRTAATLLRRDLAAEHFDGRRRLSDPSFFQSGPPLEGFFRIWQGSPSQPLLLATLPSVYEGADANGIPVGIPSVRTVDRMLHFTVRLRGNNPQDFFGTSIPSDTSYTGLRNYLSPDSPPDTRYQVAGGLIYTCQVIEVSYYLRPNGETAQGTPLYTLYRRQMLTVPNNAQFNWAGGTFVRPIATAAPPTDYYSIWALADYAEISCKPNFDKGQTAPANLYFNNLTDLTIPERRFGMDPTQPGGIPTVQTDLVNGSLAGRTYPTLATDAYSQLVYNPPSTFTYPPKIMTYDALANSDALLQDVISFDVKIYDPSSQTFVDVPASSTNPLYASATGVHVFDTWSQSADPTQVPSPTDPSKTMIIDTYDYSTAWKDTNPASPPAVQLKRLPLQMSIKAIQITLRVWDKKTQKTRQLTFIQDM